MDIDINFYFNPSNAFRKASSDINFTSFFTNLHNGWAILEKSLMNIQWKLACPKKLPTPLTEISGGNLLNHLNLHFINLNTLDGHIMTQNYTLFHHEVEILLVKNKMAFFTLFKHNIQMEQAIIK